MREEMQEQFPAVRASGQADGASATAKQRTSGEGNCRRFVRSGTVFALLQAGPASARRKRGHSSSPEIAPASPAYRPSMAL